MRRTIAGPSRSTSLVIQIVGATAPSSSRFMKTLLPRRSEPSSSLEAGEQVVRLVDHDDRPSRDAADRVGDQQRRDALASVRLAVRVVGLAAKLDGEADARAERLGELALAGPRRAVEEQVGAAAARASELAGGRDDPRGEVAQLAEVLEVAPAQRGAGGSAEQEVADAARAKPRQGEQAANDDRQARRL